MLNKTFSNDHSASYSYRAEAVHGSNTSEIGVGMRTECPCNMSKKGKQKTVIYPSLLHLFRKTKTSENKT